MQLATLTNSTISVELFNQSITDYYHSDDTNSRPIPAVRTDAVYLYLLYCRYSRMSSLIRRFSRDSAGRGSLWSSRALNTSALILALIWARAPLFSSVSFKTVTVRRRVNLKADAFEQRH